LTCRGVAPVNQFLPLGSWTPLMHAARQGSLAGLRALMDEGADLNVVDPDGATALVIAIINANFDEAAALVEKGANPNIGDKEAKMAALYAAVDMHRLAIGHGRPNTKPSGNLDAVDLIKILLAHGADPNQKLSGSHDATSSHRRRSRARRWLDAVHARGQVG
jgi:ankyrin repeat protein